MSCEKKVFTKAGRKFKHFIPIVFFIFDIELKTHYATAVELQNSVIALSNEISLPGICLKYAFMLCKPYFSLHGSIN